MKRVAAALVMLGAGLTLGAPANAATNSYGSAKLSWQVATTTSVGLVTDYSATSTVQGTALPTFTAVGGGSCGAPTGSEVANSLTFGTIGPAATGYTGCNYPNAIALGVATNDQNGVKVYEYLDSAPPAGTQICAFPNDTVFAAKATGSLGKATASYGTACTTGGTLLASQSGTTSGSGPGAAGTGAAGTANTNPYYMPYSGTGGMNFVNATGALSSMQWAGQDVQLNVNATAPATSTANTISIVFAVIPQ